MRLPITRRRACQCRRRLWLWVNGAGRASASAALLALPLPLAQCSGHVFRLWSRSMKCMELHALV